MSCTAGNGQSNLQMSDTSERQIMSAENEKALMGVLEAPDVVLFVGSGLSVWAGLPNWATLIDKLILFVESKTGLTQAAARRSFGNSDFLVAADHLLRRITRPELSDFLARILGFSSARPHLVHELLARLGPSCILTTNYDRLIEEQFAKTRGEHLRVVTNRRVADFADIIRSDAKNYIFKIHGSIDDSSSIVLSETHYHNVILNSYEGGSRSVFETLKIIMATRPIVFLGYSVRDVDFLLALRFLQQTFDRNAGRYWAILPDVDQEERERLWDAYRIRSISYETRNGKHTAFVDLLQKLADRPHLVPVNDTPATILAVGRYGNQLSRMDPGARI